MEKDTILEDEFIMDYFTLARKEYENRIEHEKYMKALDSYMKKTLNIPIYEYPSEEWFKEQGWESKEYTYATGEVSTPLTKDNLVMGGQIGVYRDGDKPMYIFLILDTKYKEHKDRLVFKGIVGTEAEFKTLEQILLK